MAGITANGFELLTRDEIVESINASFKAAFGGNFDTTPESPDGQVIGIVADAVYNQWQLAESSYSAFQPSVVGGVGLEYLCELNGVYRKEGKVCTAKVNLDGVEGTYLPAGVEIANEDGDIFFTLTEATLPATDVAVEAKEYGDLNVTVGAINQPSTQIVGWTSVVNTEAGTLGYVAETDEELRAVRSAAAVSSGTGCIEAIYAGLARLGLEDAYVTENTNSYINDLGQQPHSVHVVVSGGSTSDIAKVIAVNKPCGIRCNGLVEERFTDSRGTPYTIKFDRPATKAIHGEVTIRLLSGALPTYESDIRNAVAAKINKCTIGMDVIWSDIFLGLSAISGITIDSVLIGEEGNLLTQTHAIGALEIATCDPSNISVVVVNG